MRDELIWELIKMLAMLLAGAGIMFGILNIVK